MKKLNILLLFLILIAASAFGVIKVLEGRKFDEAIRDLNSTDENKALVASSLLKEFRNKSMPKLIRALNEKPEKERVKILILLGEMADPSCLDAVLIQLDKGNEVLSEATQTLLCLHDANNDKAFRDKIADEVARRMESLADKAEMLARVLGYCGSGKHAPALLNLLTFKSQTAVIQAMTSLEKIATRGGKFDVSALEKSKDSKLRVYAGHLLCAQKNEAGLDLLTEYLKSTDAEKDGETVFRAVETLKRYTGLKTKYNAQMSLEERKQAIDELVQWVEAQHKDGKTVLK